MSSKITAGLSLLISLLLLSIVSCSGTAVHKIYTHETSHYYSLNDPVTQPVLNSIITDGNFLPIEMKNNNFVVLKKNYHKEQRAIKDINYAGMLFYYDPSALSSNRSSRMLSIYKPDKFEQKVAQASRRLLTMNSIEKGWVLLFDAMETITDQQAEILSEIPLRCLIFDNLTYISAYQAELLSRSQGTSLCLNGLLWLGDYQAVALAKFGGQYLNLNGLYSLEEPEAKLLLEFQGEMVGLSGVNSETKTMLSRLLSENQNRVKLIY